MYHKKTIAIALVLFGTICVFQFIYINFAGRAIKALPILSSDSVYNAPEQSNVKTNILQQSERSQDSNLLKEEILQYQDRAEYKDGDIRLKVFAMGVDEDVLNGVDYKQLRRGPGLYNQSDLPNAENGRVIIAAHRDVFGAWFYDIDKMKDGDEIVAEFCGKQYVYEYVETVIVEKDDWSITKPRDFSAIVLTSCTPKGTSDKRIAVIGRLKEVL